MGYLQQFSLNLIMRVFNRKTVYCIRVFFIVSSFGVYSQNGQWTWMGGDAMANSPAVFGTMGQPSTTNKPPCRYEASEWTDLQGNFWLFGGSGQPGMLNDLWRYNPSTLQWTWVSGSQTPGQQGNYGTLGVPSASNTPGARGFGAATWVDENGNFWLFGGNGFSTSAGTGFLNDLWKFNPNTNEWTWVKGANIKNDKGSYGSKLVPAPTNLPRSRGETSASWADTSGNLWLFGGNPEGAQFNDLWQYNIASNEWTWMHGDSIAMVAGKYGTLGVPTATTCPGSRWAFAKWQNGANEFFLFGGFGRDKNATQGRLNDLWKYTPLTNQWCWISGTDLISESGTMDSICENSSDIPSGKQESRATWKIQDQLIMFGGYNVQGFYNEIWSFDLNQMKWKWIAGDALPNAAGVYGSLQVPAPTNKPSARWGSVGWKDLSGDLWLFGGQDNTGQRNDLWKFKPDPVCLGLVSTTGILKNEQSRVILLHPNPFHDQTEILVSDAFQYGELRVYDSTSRLLLEKRYLKNEKIIIQKDALPPGIYFVTLNETGNNLHATGKFVVE
jgi:N-acetylneuraminic acid mutarotase